MVPRDANALANAAAKRAAEEEDGREEWVNIRGVLV